MILPRLRRSFALLALLFLAFPSLPAFGKAAEDSETTYATLLRRYVSPSGVRYADWKNNAADVAALQTVVDSIARAPAGEGKGPAQLAFYLNAYNAWILHEKIAEYPRGKTHALPPLGFFKQPRITVEGKQMSFNDLETNLVRQRFNDPRVHFALNCASVSCPPLIAEPYVGSRLDAQLDGVAKRFINSDSGVRAAKDGRSAEVSKIFDWYKDDFAKTGGALAFINRFHAPPLPADAKLGFQGYDWTLNEAK